MVVYLTGAKCQRPFGMVKYGGQFSGLVPFQVYSLKSIVDKGLFSKVWTSISIRASKSICSARALYSNGPSPWVGIALSHPKFAVTLSLDKIYECRETMIYLWSTWLVAPLLHIGTNVSGVSSNDAPFSSPLKVAPHLWLTCSIFRFTWNVVKVTPLLHANVNLALVLLVF